MIRLAKHLAILKINGENVIRCAVCRRAVPPDHTPGYVTMSGATCDASRSTISLVEAMKQGMTLHVDEFNGPTC